MNTKNDIRQMMEDVRKAHRLIYQYQDRMHRKIILKIQLIENKEVTLLAKLNW